MKHSFALALVIVGYIGYAEAQPQSIPPNARRGQTG